jgi:hypothetical protein
MQKAIIPKEILPPISSDGRYILRYRVASEDKNRVSDWSRIYSIYGKLVKDILGYDEEDGEQRYPDGVPLDVVATEDGMSISWDLPVELQATDYDVFVKWSYDGGTTYDEDWILISTVRVNTAYTTRASKPSLPDPTPATHMKARIQIVTWDKRTTIDDTEIIFDSSTTSNNYVLVAQSVVGTSTIMRNDSGSIA